MRIAGFMCILSQRKTHRIQNVRASLRCYQKSENSASLKIWDFLFVLMEHLHFVWLSYRISSNQWQAFTGAIFRDNFHYFWLKRHVFKVEPIGRRRHIWLCSCKWHISRRLNITPLERVCFWSRVYTSSFITPIEKVSVYLNSSYLP